MRRSWLSPGPCPAHTPLTLVRLLGLGACCSLRLQQHPVPTAPPGRQPILRRPAQMSLPPGEPLAPPPPRMALITPAPVFSQRRAHLFLGTRLFLYPAAPSLTHLRTSPDPAPWSVLRERPLSEQLLCSKTVSDRLVSRRVSPAKSVTVLARPYHLTDVDAAPGRGKRFRDSRVASCSLLPLSPACVTRRIPLWGLEE